MSDVKGSPIKPQQSPSQNESLANNEALRRSKYQREAQGIDATFLLSILEEVVLKEGRL